MWDEEWHSIARNEIKIMGTKTMRETTSISNRGVMTVNTGPDMFDYEWQFLIPRPGVVFHIPYIYSQPRAKRGWDNKNKETAEHR